ncbi:MAG: ABC transporter substrate-binding protein [Chloroflexi bacterium]|nr:ABC transporter substrate-binding protein [Chloroflexota bacterium]
MVSRRGAWALALAALAAVVVLGRAGGSALRPQRSPVVPLPTATAEPALESLSGPASATLANQGGTWEAPAIVATRPIRAATAAVPTATVPPPSATPSSTPSPWASPGATPAPGMGLPLTSFDDTARPPRPTRTPSPSPSPTDPLGQVDPQGQTVVFWHTSREMHGETLQAMAAEFNAGNAWGIQVQAVYIGSYGEIFRRLQEAIHGGQTPDLAVAYANQTALYARTGGIVPLEPYLASERFGLSAAEQADIFPAFLAADRLPEAGGQLMGFPTYRSADVLYYNLTWLQRLGYEGPPQTWTQFEEMCQRAADPANDATGYAFSASASTFAGWVWSRGGELLTTDGRAAFQGAPGVQALTMLQRLAASGGLQAAAEYLDDQRAFTAGRALFTFGSSAGLPYYQEEIQSAGSPFQWGVAPFPSSTGRPVVVAYGPSWTVFRSTPEKQLAAWLFTRWFTQPENTARWAMAANYFPVRQSALSLPAMQEYLAAHPQYRAAFETLPYGRVEPSLAAWNEARGLLNGAVAAALRGEKAEAALRTAAEAADALLAP